MRGEQETQEDDFMINIQDDEAEIGPIDDEIEEMGPGCQEITAEEDK